MDQMWDNWHVKQVLLDNWNHLQRNTHLLREGIGPFTGNSSSAGNGQCLNSATHDGSVVTHLTYSGASKFKSLPRTTHPDWSFFMVIFCDSKWTGLVLWCRLQLHCPPSPLHYIPVYLMRCNILSSPGSVAEKWGLLACYAMSEGCVGNCLSVDMT